MNNNIHIYKRFTGGGTVYVDNNTWFVSMIINETAINNLKLWPRHIMKYTYDIYKDVFNNDNVRDTFILRDNDYCFNNVKFGGNAQSITNKRWLHHTSFLYSYDINMFNNYLLLPNKQPEYRQQRKHSDFVTSLKDNLHNNSILHNRQQFQQCIVHSITRYFKPHYNIDNTKPHESSYITQDNSKFSNLLNITDDMIQQVPLLSEVKRLHQYGKYSIGTKTVDLTQQQ